MKKINKKFIKNYLVLMVGLLGILTVLVLISMSTKAMIWDQLISTSEGMQCIKIMKHADPNLYEDLQRSYSNMWTLFHLIELP